jgi:dTDP-4-dehydrorhamnose reductase
MRRVLVTGGNGQLGEAIRRAAEGSKSHYIFATIDELNICNGADVERYITENEVDTIINCAAYTDVECAEDNGNFDVWLMDCADEAGEGSK